MEAERRDSSSNMMDISFDATAAAYRETPTSANLGTPAPVRSASPGQSSKRIDLTPDEDPLNPALFTSTKAQFLKSEAAKVGWLSKEGHIVKNWKRRYFILWPRAGSAWAAQHSRTVKLDAPIPQQLLLYYESEQAKAPKGVIALRRGEFQIGSEHGTAYRGEDSLVLTVQANATSARKQFILQSDVPGDPTDLMEWARLMEEGTLGKPLHHAAVVRLDEPVTFIVHCPTRQKAPGVKDRVMWRRSPSMEDKVELDVDGEEIFAGIEDGSRVQGVAENSEWLQAENGYWVPKLLLQREDHAAASSLRESMRQSSDSPSLVSSLPFMTSVLPEGLPPQQTVVSNDDVQMIEVQMADPSGHAPTAVSADVSSDRVQTVPHLSLDDAQAVQQLLADGWAWPTEAEQMASGIVTRCAAI